MIHIPFTSPRSWRHNFLRAKLREDSFYRRIMPPIPVSNDELDRVLPPDDHPRFFEPEYVVRPADYLSDVS